MTTAARKPAGASRSLVASFLSPFYFLVSIGLFLAGLLVYLLFRRTPRLSFHAMRRVYGPTNGVANKIAHRIARWARPMRTPVTADGVLGAMSSSEIESLVRTIDEQGYVVLDRLLPESSCDALLAFARTQPCTALGQGVKAAYPESEAKALRYDFAESDILTSPEACQLAFDGTFAAIAEAYFRCRPVYDFTAMWWTTPHGERDLSKAAQEFHFDMDRLVFLKFFVYLSDVNDETGPHVFVAGTHRQKPRALRDAVRFSDELVDELSPSGAVRRICGPRGTIFAADTSGIHKGMPVVRGQRLVLQVEFATGKFGQNYPDAKVGESALREAGISLPLDTDVYADVRVQETTA